MRTVSLTLLGILVSPSCAFAPPNHALCKKTSPSPFLPSENVESPTRSSTRLAAKNDFPTPLATEGDWSAYLDEETTGYVYYFNGVTGESKWEKPTDTFPDIESEANSSKVTKKEGGGILGALFNSDRKKSGDRASGTTQQQLLDLEKIASNNDDFLSELDDVIAEAEEAIKIAEDLEKQPASKRGGLLSAFGFGKKEATVESLIADVEERTSKIEKAVGGEEKKGLFASLRFGGIKPKVEEKEEDVITTAPQPEENVWVEGLKNLFQRTYASFSPPRVKTSPDKKIVAVEEEYSESVASQPKAKVSDSDFLDVIWGAETSARPTLNIAEMMKAFQVQTQETPAVTEQATEAVKTLSLDMAMQVKPHPEKISWGGEDAVFLNGRNFGVFDGVSGAEKVRGKKLYSVSLAESMKKQSLACKSSWTVSEIINYMNKAKEVADVEGTGASTAVVASIGQDNVLRALNLGDSVCLVIRDRAVAARTREIIHYFDCPYQLGEDSPDRPKDGTTLETNIYPGDIIIAGSDGVFDNLSDGDILELISSNANLKANILARKICEASRSVSLDYDAVTPYSRAARGRSGYAAYQSGRGGKVDDISCVVVKAS